MFLLKSKERVGFLRGIVVVYVTRTFGVKIANFGLVFRWSMISAKQFVYLECRVISHFLKRAR